MENDVLYAVWLLLTAGVGSDITRKTVERFSSFRDLYFADEKTLSKFFDTKEIRKLSNKNLEKARETLEYCEKNGIETISCFSHKYPPLLRNMEIPPIVLFVKGKLPNFHSEPSITVVGSRNCPDDYKKIASKISYELALGGFVTVTGVASGIDTFALKGALLAGGKTVTVLPCGISVDYSSESRKAKDFILKNGAIISEYLPKTPAYRFNFLRRNTVLSAISPATLVVAAAKNSGTMITAKTAAEQGKYLFAIPGNVFSKNSEGTNEILRTGAILCRSSLDIFEEYQHFFDGKMISAEDFVNKLKTYKRPEPENRVKIKEKPEKKSVKKEKKPETVKEIPIKREVENLSDEEKKIYSFLSENPQPTDIICSDLSLSFQKAIVILQEMAIKGLIEEKGGGIWNIR